MPNVKRWAVREAGIATFYALSDISGGVSAGEPIVTLKSLKTSGVETTGETVYARGGRGNAKLVGFSSNRESTLSLQDALFDNEALAMLTGNNIIKGTAEIDVSETFEVSTPGATESFSLKATPLDVSDVHAYSYVDGMKDGAELTKGSLTGQDMEIDTSGMTAGDKIIIYYTANTDAEASKAKVTSDAFGGTFKVVIDIIVVDSVTKAEYAAQLRVPNAKFEDDFTLDLAAEGDPSVLDLGLEVLKSADNEDMWELVIYDDEALV